jgi:hypothetical protein
MRSPSYSSSSLSSSQNRGKVCHPVYHQGVLLLTPLVAQSLQSWWGNTVYLETLDAQGGSAAAALHVSEGEIFGWSAGTWH